MRALIRNLTSAITLNYDFTGLGTILPAILVISPGESQSVETTLTIIDFRANADIDSSLTAGEISLSFSDDSRSLN